MKQEVFFFINFTEKEMRLSGNVIFFHLTLTTDSGTMYTMASTQINAPGRITLLKMFANYTVVKVTFA